MISHKHKFIFVHINKTGGSSIERVFDPNIPTTPGNGDSVGNTHFVGKHRPISEMQRLNRDCFDSYFKFAFVRNPWAVESSLHSWFKYLGATLGELSLKDFLSRRVETKKMGFRKMLGNSEQYSLMDYIGRFETLQQDFDTICEKVGLPAQKLPHVNNVKCKKHYTEYYDDETRQIVAEQYKEDIEHFGYKFGD